MSELGDLHGAITKCNSKSQSSDIYTHRLESGAIPIRSIHLGYLTKNFIFYLLNFYFLLLIKFFFFNFIFINGCDWNTTIISTIKVMASFAITHYTICLYICIKSQISERERASENCETDTERENESTSATKCFNPITR